MGVLTYCVVLALALIAVIHGQPDPGTGFNAKLSKTLTIRKTGWTSLTGYSTAKDGARLKFVRTGFNFANGVYTVPKSGVYFVSAQVSIQNGNVGYFRLLVAINSQNNVHNSMHAIKSNAKWYIYSMHVNGFLYLSEGDTIVANVFSQRDTLFQMLTTSSFSAMYMGPVFQHVGFSADLWGSRSFRKTGWSEITGYSTTAYNYLWNNGDGFSTSSGRFTAPCDGVYYVAGNIRMDGANGNYFRLVASVNGSANTNAGLASVEGVPRAPYYTQNVGGAVHLNKGDWISLWVYSDNDNTFVMQSESSFHVMFLGPRSASAPAFMADLNRVITIPNTNPYKLTVYRTTGAPGLYATSGFNAGSGTFFVPFTGLYAVSFLVRFNNAKGLTQAYINAGGPSAGNNYVYASRSWATSRAMDSFTLKGSAVVYLTQGNQVSVYVRCAVKNCQIGTESSFSAALLGPNLPHPGVHADVARDTRITTKWAKASVWNTAFATGTGLYATDGNWDGTQYIAATPGIYYVACNLRLDYATRSPLTRATIAINDKYDYAHGIHGVDSSGAAFVTFTMSGFVRLKSGDTVSVWAYSDDTSYTLSTMSGFSVNRMGSAFDLPSFLADLNTNQTISKTVYTPLANWNANAGYGTFTTGFSFDEPSGVFTAPYTGKYVVTANIRFDNVKANAYYRVVICPYTSATAFSCSVNSGLHSIRGTLATPPKYFSESVQATIPLTAGQRIGVFVFGNKVPYTVNSESGFSACFIPGNPYGFNGDLNGNFNLAPTSGSTWREVRRAFRVKDSRTPQLWSTGFTQATGSMTIPSDGTGVYIVSANIRFDRASGNNFRLLIAINDVRTTANGLSSMQGTPVNTYFSQQVVGTVYLKGGSRISLYIYNTRTTATFSLQSESGFSAVMVSGNQYTRPSFLADLVSTVNIRGTGWKLVTNYMFHSAQFYTWGLHKFGNGTFSKGYYKIPQSGIWYLSGNLRLNAAGGRYTRLVLAINGQYTLNGGLHSITGPPSASYYTLHVAGAIQVTAGQTISMWLYSNSDPSYSVDTESSFSAFFLGAPNLFPGFNVDMAGSVRRGRGVQRPASFRTTGANGLFSSVPATNLDLRTGTFTAPYAGVYLVSCSLRLDSAGTGYFRTMISINGSLSTTQPTLSAVKSGSLHASYHTTNIFGALQLAKGAKIAPVTQSTADTSWNFQHESGWSAVYIGAAGQVSGMTSKGAYSRRVTNLGGRWLQLGYWDVSAPGFFGDEYFQPYGGRYTTPNAGKYYVSANIRLDNVDSGYIYSKILINNNLSGRSRITSLMGNQVSGGQPNTLSMSGVLYLPAFTYISIAIVASSDNDFMINGDSTFSVIYLGTNDNPECVKGGPVIAVHPLDTQVFVGDPLVLNCRALSVPPATLSWYFNGALVPGQTSETFSVTASNSGAGNYQCRATANGRTVNSFTAAVVVYGHDGTVPGFAADVLSTVTLTNQMAKWYTVTRWRTASAAQTNLYDTGTFDESTGVFTVPLSGIYLVALNLRLDSIAGDSMQAVVSINNGNGINNGMSAIQGFPTQWQTININAAIYLKKRQTLRVKAFSQTDPTWGVQSESGWSVRYLAPVQSVPGTMWELGADIQRAKNGWFEVTGWRNIWDQRVGTGVNNVAGRFTAPCNGIYYVASNIRVENANGAYFRSLVAVNGKTDVSNGLHHIQGSPKTNYFTMTVVGVVQMTKGQNLSAMIFSYNDPSFTIDTASSMSVAYLSPTSVSVPGFHADLLRDLTFKTINTWEVIKGWRTTGSAGLFQSGSDFNANTGFFTASTPGVYHVSAMIRLDSASGRYFRIAVNVDNKPTLHNGMHSIRGYPPSNYYTLTVSGTVPLEAGQNISIIAYSNTDRDWRVQHESGFSVYLLERISPGVHAEMRADNKMGSTQWTRVKNWRTNPGKNDGLFQTGAEFNAATGYYTVSAPGVYYVAANLRFDQLTTGQAYMNIAVNDDTTINNGLNVRESYLPQKNTQFSLRTSGFIRLRLGDTVSVYVKSQTDKAYNVQHESGFSLAYVAPPLSIPAFLADYTVNQNYRAAGWYELNKKWAVEGKDSLFISGGQAFNRNNGRFTVPAPGTYWVVANIMFTGLDATGGALHAAIGVNGVYDTTTGLHVMRSSSPAKSALFSLMVSGALQLDTGDYLSVFVGSDKDTNWGVSSQSGFSAAFIGTKLLQGFTAWGPPVSRKSTGWIRQAGFNTTGFPGLFNTFGSQPANGLWTVPQSGWYYLAANHHITGGSGFMRSLIGISLSLTANNGLHSAQGNPTTESSPSVAGIARLRKGQTLSNHFFSQTDKSWSYSTQGFSAVEIGDYHPLPSFHAFRWGVNVAQSGWYNVAGFNTNAYSWTYDQQTGTFDNAAGLFTAYTDGVYWVSGQVQLQNAAGRYFRLVVSVNAQNSLQGGLHSVTGPPTTNDYTLAISGSLYMKAGDTCQLSVFSSTDLSWRIARAQFAMHFLEYTSASLGFNVDQMASTRGAKLSWTSPGSWTTFGANGLYINGTGLDTKTGIYTVPYTGIYLVSLNARVDGANAGYFRVKVAINGSDTKEYGMTVSKTGATHGNYYTLNLVNALYLTAGTTLRPRGWSNADTNWYYQQESGWNAVFLSSRNEIQAVHAKLAANVTMNGGGTKRLQGWTTNSDAAPFMADRSFDETKGIFTALVAGNYFISFNVRVDGISTGDVAVQARINGGQPAVLHASEGLPVNTPTQLSINSLTASGIVRMKRFQKLSVYVSFVDDKSFRVVDESSMSIAFVGGSSPERCPLTGVSFIQQPVSGRAAVGSTFNFSCIAEANGPIKYQWNKNGRAIAGANNQWYNLTNIKTTDQAWYRCDATSGSDYVRGLGAQLIIYNQYPVFRPAKYDTAVFENIPKGRSILKVIARAQKPNKQNQAVSYKIVSGAGNSFAINVNTGVMTRGNRNIDYERQTYYSLVVRATNKAATTFFTDVRINITILDLNDNKPVFVPKAQTVSVYENLPVFSTVATLTTTDRDMGSNTDVAYNLTGGNGRGFFAVSGNKVIVATALDRDFSARPVQIKLWFRAYNPTIPGGYGSGTVTVKILDVNDNSPIFVRPVWNLNVSEAIGQNAWIARIRATDKDYGTNGTLAYSVVSGNADKKFTLNTATGVLRMAGTLDYDNGPKFYQLTVQAIDGGKPAHYTTVIVNVQVENANDNIPLFTLPLYMGQITENLPAGQSIVTVLATEKDTNMFTYSIDNGNFSINASGVITTTGPLDREAGTPFIFTVSAIDVVAPNATAHTGTAMVSVDIIDVNDNTPAFTQKNYPFTIPETIPTGAVIGAVTANDPDDALFGTVTYTVSASLAPVYIQPATGIIETTAPIDYVTTKSFSFTVTATDGGGLSSTSVVSVTVQNVNLHAPAFLNATYYATLPENSKNGTGVTTVSATDIDQQTGLTYLILHGSNGRFVIDAVSGAITVSGPLDYEVQPGYELVVACNDNGVPNMQNITFVYVTLTDVNDNPPVFDPPKESASISRLAPAGTVVYRAMATDADSGVNAQLTYVLAGAQATLFNLSSTNGTLTLAQAANTFPGTSVSVQITAADGGIPTMFGSLQITDNIMPPNGDAPQFALDVFRNYVMEDAPVGQVAITALAFVADVANSGDILYSIAANPMFAINPTTGNIYTTDSLDRETTAVYDLKVTASIGEGFNTISSDGRVVITVMDVNDNAPTFFNSTMGTKVSEQDSAGTPVFQLQANDADAGKNTIIRYSIVTGGDGVFSIDPYLGTIYTTQKLNRKVKSSYLLTVAATNPTLYPLTSTAQLTVTVVEENDHNPEFDHPWYHFYVLENAIFGANIGKVYATDIDQGVFGQFSYSILPGGNSQFFKIDPSSGQITLSTTLDREKKKFYGFQVRATDGGGLFDQARVLVYVDDVNDNAPVMNPSTYYVSLSQGVPVGTGVIAIRATDRDTGTNGAAGFVYSITGGDTTGRFAVDSSTGIISVANPLGAVPTINYIINVQVADGGSPAMTASGVLNITSHPASTVAPVFTYPSYSVSLNSPQLSGATVLTVQATGNGTLNYRLGTKNVPFKVDWTTGVITLNQNINSDTRIDTWIFTIQATDRLGLKGFTTVHVSFLHRNEYAPVFQPLNQQKAVMENATAGQRIVEMRATDADDGSDGQVTYSIIGGVGFDINPADGWVTVDPLTKLDRETRATYTLIVSAADGGTPPLTSTSTLLITVSDVNDNPPIFTQFIYNSSIQENQAAGSYVATVVATDADTAPNANVTYRLSRPGPLFGVDPFTGVVSTLAALDREGTDYYEITIIASDGKFTDSCHVDIFVTDDNDHGPVFTAKTYDGRVQYDAPIGTPIANVLATDADIGSNAISQYSLGHTILSDYLNVSSGGVIYILESPIPAETPEFTMPVYAVDSRNSTLRANATFMLTLLGLPEIIAPTRASEQTGASGSLSGGVVAGIAIACILGTLLVVMLVIVIVRRGQPRHEPFESDGVKYEADTGHLAGVGISNPMYSSGSAAAIENPTYAQGNIQDETRPDKYGL